MPRRNRVDPLGDLHAVPEHGMFTGNRGCLVDQDRRLVRHHRGNLWITCLASYRDWRSPLDQPGRWTPLFFLDDAVALAAGHRPCGLCRRSDYLSYQEAVGGLGATEINRRLASQRLRRGRGLDRASDRILWRADIGELPEGTVVLDPAGRPNLVNDGSLFLFGFDGWRHTGSLPGGEVQVLTPPLSVRALGNGFVPTLHHTASTP
jgi:PAS domain-containing protein